MKHIPNAYVELVETLLSKSDRFEFERAIGAAITEGTKQIVLIYGDPASGKSTLLSIAGKIFIFSNVMGIGAPPVVLQHEGYIEASTGTTVFAAINKPIAVDGSVTINTTGKRVSPQKLRGLMSEIAFGLGAISEHCTQVHKNS